jgi:hypothetical protein
MSTDKQDERIEDLAVEPENAAEVAGGDATAQQTNTLTNIQKIKHDAAMASIQNTR